MDNSQNVPTLSDKKDILSIGQASEYLGVSIDTLRRWEKKGKVESLRSPGGHRYYERKQLDNLFGKKYERLEPTHRPKAEEITEVTPAEVRPTQDPPKTEEIISETIVEESVFILDRPLRNFEVPQQEPLRVARTEDAQRVPPQPPTYVTQTVQPVDTSPSVLTPPQQATLSAAPPPVLQTVQTDIKIKETGLNISLDRNKLLAIAAVVLFVILILIVLFIVRSSQDILSPVP